MAAEKRNALVTGANRGIGLEVVRQLAAKGYRTVLSARNGRAAETAASRMRADGMDVIDVPLDVTSVPSIDAARRSLERKGIALDVLVNNAAILVGEGEDVLNSGLERYRTTLETNVIGPLAVCQAFVPGMVERGYGRVVNVSSEAGQLSSMSTYAPAYSLSKAALNALTRQLAGATRGTSVLVNSACPGWVRTDMGGPSAPLSVEDGADTIVWLATLPAEGPTGGFFSKRHEIAW